MVAQKLDRKYDPLIIDTNVTVTESIITIITIRSVLYIHFIKKEFFEMDDKENLLLADLGEGIPAKEQIEDKKEDKVEHDMGI